MISAIASVGVFSAGLASIDITWAAPHKRHTTAAAVARDTDTTTTATIPVTQGKTTQGKTTQGKTTPGKASPSPQVQQTATAQDDDETLPAPFHLPQAPRTRMRECGLKWQAMKMSGAVGEDIWRDFATRCLAAAAGPFDKRS